MKKVLFILLVFISFQGFSQKVAITESYNFEVMEKDLGNMTWVDANKACEKLGEGWRLPTIEELTLIFYNRDKIGGFFERAYYWSSTDASAGEEEIFFVFGYGEGDVDFLSSTNSNRSRPHYVRAVRDLK
jgi:hypothetical protein